MDGHLAVIPARGGSTRLKDKNIAMLAGKPLINWITEAVIESKCYDKIIISTDNEHIYSSVQHLDSNLEWHRGGCMIQVRPAWKEELGSL